VCTPNINTKTSFKYILVSQRSTLIYKGRKYYTHHNHHNRVGQPHELNHMSHKQPVKTHTQSRNSLIRAALCSGIANGRWRDLQGCACHIVAEPLPHQLGNVLLLHSLTSGKTEFIRWCRSEVSEASFTNVRGGSNYIVCVSTVVLRVVHDASYYQKYVH